MKWSRVLALVLAAAMAVCMAGCGSSDDGVADTSSDYIEAVPGGEVDVSNVAGLDTAARMSCVAQDGAVYVAFANIQNKSTDYFHIEGDTITVVCRTTSDAPATPTYRLSLWMLNENNKAQYVNGCMALVDADDTCYTCTFTGLDPAKEYKLTVGYASASYYITGVMKVSPATDTETAEEAKS